MATRASVEQRLLDRVLSADAPPRLADLTPIVPTAQACYFALHRAADTDPVHALDHEFPRLVAALSRDSQPVRRVYVGRVRGKIDWAGTIRARGGDDHNPHRFVCREADRITDTPQNQLVVWVLEQLDASLRAVPDTIRRGTARHGVAGERYVNLAPQIDRLLSATHRMLRHPLMRSVTRTTEVTEDQLQAADRCRAAGYDVAAELARRWQLVRAVPLDGLTQLGRESLLLPAANAADADPWVELAALLLRRRR